MNHSDGWLDLRHSRARGTSRLYRQCWRPDSGARAAVLLVHGLGEHSGRYEYLAQHCTNRGFTVHTHDHYGHGKSEGQPGYVERFSVYLDGVRALIAHAREEDPGLPLFLLGHSMGGLIAAAMLPDHQAEFEAAVFSGPAFKSDVEPPAIVMALNRLLSALVPTAPVIALDPTGMSRDPEVVSAYISDPLVHHGKLASRLVAEMKKAMMTAVKRAAEVTLPLLVLHGDADPVTSPVGSAEYVDAAGSADKALKLYPGLYHEVFNEPEKDAVLGDMTTFLEAHLP